MIQDAVTETDAPDMLDAIDRVDGNMELLTKLVDRFRSERTQLFAALRRSIEGSDTPARERAAYLSRLEHALLACIRRQELLAAAAF